MRLEHALKLGAHYAIDISQKDPVQEILLLTGRRGVDVAIEALGRQETFENALRVLRPGGTLSSQALWRVQMTTLKTLCYGLSNTLAATTITVGF